MSGCFAFIKFRPLTSIILILLLNPALAGWVQQSQDIMGTRISVETWHTSNSQASICNSKVMASMHRIDGLMSPYKQDSEISAINREAAIEAVRISQELFDLINKSNTISRLSGGAFDITFASVGYQYNFRENKQPSQEQINGSLDSIDYKSLILKDNSVRFAKPSMRIDLGGIAKGYAVDQGIQILKQCGVQHAIVSAGGDSRILGDKRGRPWMMGIQHPRKKQQVALVLPLSNSAISTSGDYERFFLRNGERIHHIINPTTGRSAKSAWSATVIGPDATTTDALSTTLFILGAKKGIELVNSLPDIDAVIIDSKGLVHYSSGLQDPQAVID